MVVSLACELVLGLGFSTCAADLVTDRYVDVTTEALPAKTGSMNDMGAASADLDGDGDLDLTIAVEYGRKRLWLNDGTGHFADASDRLSGPAGDHEDVAIADYDRDGDQDLVFYGEDDQINAYYLNDGHARFANVTDRLPRRCTANAVVALDIEGDGDADLVVGCNGPDFVLVNDGHGTFTERSERLPAGKDVTQDIAAGDLDGDGDPDLLFGNEDGNRLYLNEGRGRFAAAELPAPAAPEETRHVALADVDGDGDLDAYFANVRLFNSAADPQDRLLLNDGTGHFADATRDHLLPDTETTMWVAFLDLDGDGDPDLIRGQMGDLNAQRSDFPLTSLANDGTGHFLAPLEVLPASVQANAFDIVPADFNGDGRMDLFIASRGGLDRLVLALPLR